MANINSKDIYSDQSVGFEIETSFIRFKKKKFKNKEVIANIKNSDGYGNYITVVAEGEEGSDKTYLEFVSKPLRTQEGIKNLFDLLRQVISGAKTNSTLSDVLKVFKDKNYSIEYPLQDNKELLMEVLSDKDKKPNSIHINLDVPFNKLNNFAKNCPHKTDSENSADLKKMNLFPLEIAHDKVRTEFVNESKGIKLLLILFFYQEIVYAVSGMSKDTVPLKKCYPYKEYKEIIKRDTNGRDMSDIAKLKFDVLFKVSKADIIRLILKADECEKLICKIEKKSNDKNYKANRNVLTHARDIVDNINILSGRININSDKRCEILRKNAESKKAESENADNVLYYYDEPRISGLLLPKKIEKSKAPNDYYIVAELRDTYLSDKAKDVFSPENSPENNFDKAVKDFIKQFCNFVDAITN
ncbi:MAG: hypothetical protein NC131_00305 [Roseburia sp.]|nr:hypothetical protein [Roseburia sp.]